MLLKVLLLDSKEDRHCASPADFAGHFLRAKGLQILLHLCSHSTFDVKSMCVKLIDVLTSHTSLIKVAIDPDVITYLCNVVLPRQMIETAASLNRKNQISSQAKQPVAYEEKLEDSQELETQMNLLLAKQSPVIGKERFTSSDFNNDVKVEDLF